MRSRSSRPTSSPRACSGSRGRRTRKLGTDLALPKVIEIGYDHGLVESKTLSVGATWSVMRFTHPKKGKAYNNSYGRLPSS